MLKLKPKKTETETETRPIGRLPFAPFLLAAAALVGGTSARAQEGMLSVPSPHDVATTIDRLEAVLEEKGMTVFARIDHASGAEKADLSLPPTELLVFGNPRVGTPLMNCSRSIAIDLPQKMLAWHEASGETRLGWNDPLWLKERHATSGCDAVFEKVGEALEGFAAAAAAAD